MNIRNVVHKHNNIGIDVIVYYKYGNIYKDNNRNKIKSVIRALCNYKKYITLYFKNLIINLSRSFYGKELVTEQLMCLNFKNRRFFPLMNDISTNKTIYNNSLGIIAKYFSNSKSYLRSKSSFILSSSYLRRLVTHLLIKDLRLLIKKTPLFLRDILNTLFQASNKLYKNPFNDKQLVNEKDMAGIFPRINYVMFVNNRGFGNPKNKKKGRLKRKISKRVFLLNSIVD